MMYLLISSTSEPAFVNLLTVPLAIIIGLVFVNMSIDKNV